MSDKETVGTALYTVSMKHDEQSLKALSHMQYDLFCKKNLIVRTLIAVVCIAVGAQDLSRWWAVLIIAYGGYLLSSKYSAANRTASKIAAQLRASGEDYPRSEYLFEKDRMRIITFPENTELDPLPYSQIVSLGEDGEAFYIFKNQYGGYMIKKEELKESREEFRSFLERASGKRFISRRGRLVGLKQWVRGRRDEPYHL